MSAPVPAVDAVRPAPLAGSRDSRFDVLSDRGTLPGEGKDAVDPERILKAVGGMGELRTSGGRTVTFNYDRDLDMVVAKITSDDTGEVIRQIPPQEYLDFVARFREMLGVLFDGRF